MGRRPRICGVGHSSSSQVPYFSITIEQRVIFDCRWCLVDQKTAEKQEEVAIVAPMTPVLPVRIGVSSCLLGEEVRYDGGHKKSAVLVEELGAHVEWIPVCPEIECGMGVPREPVRLVSSGGDCQDGDGPGGSPRVLGIRMVGIESGRDWTEAMKASAKTRLRGLGRLELSGYVLKSRSPSCGKDGVPILPAREKSGAAGADAPGRGGYVPGNNSGSGLFAAELMRYFPLLPIEDEACLGDSVARRHFLLRVFSYYRRLSSTRDFSAKALEDLCCKQTRVLESLTNPGSL